MMSKRGDESTLINKNITIEKNTVVHVHYRVGTVTSVKRRTEVPADGEGRLAVDHGGAEYHGGRRLLRYRGECPVHGGTRPEAVERREPKVVPE